MLALVFGGSGSGKSAYAEQLVCDVAHNRKKYYIATMKVYDDEGQKKVQRHRMLRQDKGFITIEQPTDIDSIAAAYKGGTALLECMSNLVANEMFAAEKIVPAEIVAKKITDGVKVLTGAFEDVVIVSNNVCEDGNSYDETTMDYIRALGLVNRQIAAMADKVAEVVVGIPVIIKETMI